MNLIDALTTSPHFLKEMYWDNISENLNSATGFKGLKPGEGSDLIDVGSNVGKLEWNF